MSEFSRAGFTVIWLKGRTLVAEGSSFITDIRVVTTEIGMLNMLTCSHNMAYDQQKGARLTRVIPRLGRLVTCGVPTLLTTLALPSQLTILAPTWREGSGARCCLAGLPAACSAAEVAATDSTGALQCL